MSVYSYQNIADSIYQDVVTDGGTVNYLQDAYDACEYNYGPIKVGSPIDDLIQAVILFTVIMSEDYFNENNNARQS
jgi:hypothetical protein